MAEPKFKYLVALKKYLSVPENPVSTAEMSDFWSSLTDAEKAEYKAYAEEHLRN